MARRGRNRTSEALRLGAALAMLALAVSAAARIATAADVVPLPPANPTLTLQSFVAPRSLPLDKQAPATFTFNVRIGTTDGSRPAALRKLTLDLDKHIVLDRRGLPVCQGGQRDIRSPHPWSVCKEAIVGRGRVRLEIQFPGQPSIPTAGELRVINASGANAGGRAALYAVAFVSRPITTVISMPITIERRPGSGNRVILMVPKIANGGASITSLNVRLGRRVIRNGEPFDLLTASCPTGRFELKATAEFEDGVVLRMGPLQECAALTRLSRQAKR